MKILWFQSKCLHFCICLFKLQSFILKFCCSIKVLLFIKKLLLIFCKNLTCNELILEEYNFLCISFMKQIQINNFIYNMFSMYYIYLKYKTFKIVNANHTALYCLNKVIFILTWFPRGLRSIYFTVYSNKLLLSKKFVYFEHSI